MTFTEDDLDRAARRTAINLMRLNEALEHQDAEGYSQIPHNIASKKYYRIKNLEQFYRQWFTAVAGGSEQGKCPDKGEAIGLDPQRLEREDR